MHLTARASRSVSSGSKPGGAGGSPRRTTTSVRGRPVGCQITRAAVTRRAESARDVWARTRRTSRLAWLGVGACPQFQKQKATEHLGPASHDHLDQFGNMLLFTKSGHWGYGPAAYRWPGRRHRSDADGRPVAAEVDQFEGRPPPGNRRRVPRPASKLRSTAWTKFCIGLPRSE